MEIILLDKVKKLGNLGDKVTVKSGYARNFLLPKGKGVSATKKNIEFFKIRRDKLAEKLSKKINLAISISKKINKLKTITIISKAGEEGKLFGSIGKRDIATALISSGIEIQKNNIHLPKGNLRFIGEYKINIQLHHDICAKINISIIAKNN
ncbi:50S ribosomal protein L9 [Serratia symbiotica]|nr:50S ribosomal protein L9 [Serratia symbiotica]